MTASFEAEPSTHSGPRDVVFDPADSPHHLAGRTLSMGFVWDSKNLPQKGMNGGERGLRPISRVEVA